MRGRNAFPIHAGSQRVRHILSLENGPCPKNRRNNTRPEGQPIATAAPYIADANGLYSWGSHKVFFPLYVIQFPSVFRL
jgi:hypothetical protein